MRIGYAKIGRASPLSPAKWGQTGGDNEFPVLLNKLARRHPEHRFVIVSRNSGEASADVGLPPNVENPWRDGVRDAFRDVATRARDLPDGERHRALTDGYREVTRHMYDDLDGLVIWAGQHGTSNAPIPRVEEPERITQPQDSFMHYVGFITAGLNAWRDVDPLRRREVWLCPDVRNYLKARDIKWPPPPVVSQFDWHKNEKHHRYGDSTDPVTWSQDLYVVTGVAQPCSWATERVWSAQHVYEYHALELSGIPSAVEFNDDWDGREHFGMIVNEARGYVRLNRLDAVCQWVLPLQPAWLFGRWTAKSQEALGRCVEPLAWHLTWPQLRTVRATFTTPSSGSGWATTKPWEAFAVGTVCFFHPAYDTQGHVVPTLEQARAGVVDHNPDLRQLALWLRVETPEQLAKRVEAVSRDREAWLWLVRAQRRRFEQAQEANACVREIEQRCGLPTT